MNIYLKSNHYKIVKMVLANTLMKDKRRSESFNQGWVNNECWKTSLKYSNMLVKNIDSGDLYSISASIYGQYTSELQSRRLPMKDKNYIQVWTTMLNTVKKGNHSRMAIKLLHQTNIQRCLNRKVFYILFHILTDSYNHFYKLI